MLKRIFFLCQDAPVESAAPAAGVGHRWEPCRTRCVALMVALVYRKRALPLAWMVSKGKKGHFSEDAHMGLVREVATLIPADARVVFLGDGEFDGCNLQASFVGGVGSMYAAQPATLPSNGRRNVSV